MKTGVGGFQSFRLTQAREALGLTKVALATLVNVSGATVTQWENGSQNPQEDKLQSLATSLGQSTHWFLRESTTLDHTPYFYRSLSSATKTGRIATKTKLNWLIELSNVFQKYVDWPAINLPNSSKQFNSLSDIDIELIAQDFRVNMNLGTGPIKDLTLAVESAGIVCARSEIGFDKLDGLSNWQHGFNRAYILLSSDKQNAIRSRFDLAHELGHMILHKNILIESLNSTNHKEIERQADLFAGSLLMPAESFAKDIRRPTLETFLTLKPRWKVSIAAMIFRAHQLDLINDLQKANLYKNLSSKGWRLKEPYDDQLIPESPRLLSRAANMLIAAGINKNDLLDQLGLPASLVESLCCLPKGFFDDSMANDNLLQFRTKSVVKSTSDKKIVGTSNNIFELGR